MLRRFVRLEASRTKPGTGLGLSLVAAVARLHGGQIRLEDNVPGLKAILSLPLAGGETSLEKSARQDTVMHRLHREPVSQTGSS